MVGEVNESRAVLNDIPCTALIDTGSQVTTLSETFWKLHLVDCPIQPLGDIIEVEGAGGCKVPFLGYIEVSISFPQNVNGTSETMDAVVLVVPDTAFNLKTPLLIGTNLIRRCKGNCMIDLNLVSCKELNQMVPGLLRINTLDIKRKLLGNLCKLFECTVRRELH